MKRTKILSLILVVILAALLCVPALTEEESTPLRGKIGSDAYYSYDEETGIVTISGTGSTEDYMPTGLFGPDIDEGPYHSPLFELEKEGHPISALVIEDGITCLSGDLLQYSNCKYIQIAASVNYIAQSAIGACNELEAVFFYGDAPDSKLYFEQCSDLKTIYHLPEAQGWDDFDYTATALINGDLYDLTVEVKTFCRAPLTDVSGTAYYAQPVAWAYKNNIVGGYEDMSFQPMNTCTRAQIVTFIWRANGSPEPQGTAQGFNDVAEGTYYYKAVLWAAEKGITGGFNDGGFHPNETVTRAQAMTFMWRAADKPAAPEGTVNSFKDVTEANYYYDAVLWAVANGITGGYNDTQFGSMDGCTRAQIVTFLYRDMA